MSTATSGHPVCAQFARRLTDSVGKRRFQMWFEQARFDYDGRCLEVAVPNRFVADWIRRHFDAQLRSVASDEFGAETELAVQVAPDRFPRRAGEPCPPPTPDAPPPRPRWQARPRYRLEQFVVGPSNALAFAAARAFIENPVSHSDLLFIHGGCGLGKTHLLQGICHQLQLDRPTARVHYTTGEQFTNDFLAAIRSKRIDVFRRHIRRLDLLAVDDVQFIAGKRATQQEFLHSLNAMELGGAHLALASDCHPKQIKLFTEALVSRCVRGMVVEVHRPDPVTRGLLLRRIAAERGLQLLDPAVELLAERCRGSVRDLQGTLTKLHALVSLARLSDNSIGRLVVGRMLIDRFFADEGSGRPGKPVRFEAILKTVESHLQVERAALLGRSRNRHIVLARSLLIHLARTLTTMSYPEIAAAMGRSSHSTAITAAKRIAKQLTDPEAIVVLPETRQSMTVGQLADRLRHAISGV